VRGALFVAADVPDLQIATHFEEPGSTRPKLSIAVRADRSRYKIESVRVRIDDPNRSTPHELLANRVDDAEDYFAADTGALMGSGRYTALVTARIRELATAAAGNGPESARVFELSDRVAVRMLTPWLFTTMPGPH
jgi:hypothetical protein